jgi:hypothetical protein
MLAALEFDKDFLDELVTGEKMNSPFERDRFDESLARSWEALRLLIENDILIPGEEIMGSADDGMNGIVERSLELIRIMREKPYMGFAAVEMLRTLKEKGYIEFQQKDGTGAIRFVHGTTEKYREITYDPGHINKSLRDALEFPRRRVKEQKMLAAKAMWLLLDSGMIPSNKASALKEGRYRLFSWSDDPEIRNGFNAAIETLSSMRGYMRVLSDEEIERLYDMIPGLPKIRDSETAEKVLNIVTAVTGIIGDSTADKSFSMIHRLITGLEGAGDTKIAGLRALLHTVDLLAARNSSKAREFLSSTVTPDIVTARNRDIADEIVDSIDLGFYQPLAPRAKEAVALLFELKIFNAGSKDDAVDFMEMAIRSSTRPALAALLSILKARVVSPGNFEQIKELFEIIQLRQSNKFMGSRDQAFEALQAFADKGVMTKDNIPAVTRLFVPEKPAAYDEAFPTLKVFAEKDIVTADNLDLVTLIFKDLLDENPQLNGFTEVIAPKLRALAGKDIIRQDNLLLIATLLYISSLKGKGYAKSILLDVVPQLNRPIEVIVPESQALAGEEAIRRDNPVLSAAQWYVGSLKGKDYAAAILQERLESILKNPEAFADNSTVFNYPGGQEGEQIQYVSSLIYNAGLNATAHQQKTAFVGFLKNKKALQYLAENYPTMEDRFRAADRGKKYLLKDYLEFAMNSGTASDVVLQNYGSFLDTWERPERS